VLDRTERRTKTGNKLGIVMLSDQTGHFEAIVFAEGCSSTATFSSPAAWWWSCFRPGWTATRCGRGIQSAEALELAVAHHQKGMRIFVATSAHLQRRRAPEGAGGG
jgi:DNA polymerase-3 subunit alpha